VAQCSGGDEFGGGFPSLAAHPPRIRLGLSVGRSDWWWTSYREPPAPPLFIVQCDGGPPTANGLSTPDQGVSQGTSGRWAILVGDQPNILPLDLTLYFSFRL
jgi:hypothetical protein